MPKTAEQCEKIKKQMKEKILHESMLYFAKNGFAGTKISDLAKYIGIGQGTIYLYFQSKEELFMEIRKLAEDKKELKGMSLLAAMPVSAKFKLNKLSSYVLKNLEDENFAGMVALIAQMALEQGDNSSSNTTYENDFYKCMTKIITQGQKENTFVAGSALKLADYYWSVVYVYALKRLFTSEYEMIDEQDLNRILIK